MLKKDSSRGFTLVSVLISLTILLTILPALAPLLVQISHIREYPENEQASVSTFFHLLQLELNQGKDYRLKSSATGIYIHESSNRSILIEQYKENVRRRMNLTGHEILLFNVKDIHFQNNPRTIQVSLQMIGGNNYERTLYKLQSVKE
ncbi:hypothetical protein GCM10008986_03980 [Salinibacillus aidingensis]|uniref:Competence protein ComGF n=1 Tax=Salinibacillus aidingensis TaxID=237684 RepID=A0ABN1ARN9_9BACI